MFFFDPIYFLFIIPPLIFMIYAQSRVKSTFNKFSKIQNYSKITGAEAAQRLLRANDLDNIKIENIKTKLGDHYDPAKKVLRLSPEVANAQSVAALGIVAHEVGHAVQDKQGYAFMRVRTSIVPAAAIGTNMGYVFLILGMLMYAFAGLQLGLTVMLVGILLFSLAIVFSLITLPVEYNASNRARAMLMSTGMVSTEELNGASAVLSAAALTYVAATLQAVAQLLYFIFMFMGARRR